AGSEAHHQAGVFYVIASMKPENRERAKKEILEEINRFKAEGPSQEELEKAKKNVLKDFARLTESTAGVAEALGYKVTIGKLEDYTQYADDIQRVTVSEVQAAVQKYLDLNKATLVEIIPPDEAKNSLAEQAEHNIALIKEVPQSNELPDLTKIATNN